MPSPKVLRYAHICCFRATLLGLVGIIITQTFRLDHWLHSGCTPRPSRARPRTTAVSGTRSPTRPRPRAGRRPCRQTHNRHIRGQDRQVATRPRHAPTPAPARRRCARTLVPCPALYSVVESEGDGHHMYAGAACAYRVSAPPRCVRFPRSMISVGDD